MPDNPPQPNNPVCSCGHPRTQHSKNGCSALVTATKRCDCKRKYMEF